MPVIFRAQANLMLVDAYHEDKLEARIELLRKAASNYTNARDFPFQAKVTEEQAKLLMAQRALEDALKQPFVNLPLGDTLYQVRGCDMYGCGAWV